MHVWQSSRDRGFMHSHSSTNPRPLHVKWDGLVLRRRYLARFEIEGEEAPIFVVFERDARTWDGVTAFAPDQTRYLLDQRVGKRVYRRLEGEA